MTNETQGDFTGWIAPFLVFLHAMVPVMLSGTQVADDLEAIRSFQELCTTTDRQPSVEVTFAPVRRLSEGEDPHQGTWGYAYQTSDQRYPDNRYSLRTGDGRIELVSTLRPPAQGTELPPFLWHVISVPTPNAADGIGFIARHDTFYARESDVLTRERYDNLRLSTLTTDEGHYLFYVDPRLLERPQETALNRVTAAWMETLGGAMSNLRITRRLEDRVYTHTFIYVDAPGAVDDINRETGDRRVSSKIVRSTGIAFGFVLNEEGRCIASTTLTLEP